VHEPIPIVEVRIWGKAVGAVALDPKLGYYAFEYQPAFVRSGIELAPLTMPLSAASEPFVFADLPELTPAAAGCSPTPARRIRQRIDRRLDGP
jgi:serine/threonine-protein kinase HipA